MISDNFKQKLIARHNACLSCPSNEDIAGFFERVMNLLFPNFSNERLNTKESVNQWIDTLHESLVGMFRHYPTLCSAAADGIADKFISRLESIEELLQTDIEAIYAGDPAAKDKEEIIRSYPGFYAIAAYRVAHELHRLGVKVVPRIITEHAHHRTGIDIHPGATIDHSFCIDHGTGVVIGETAHIGHHVKLYQGVTLGALSVNKEDADVKRHPTIEPHVVVYANTTILGGKTVIGEHSIIGGNVWITKSVAAHSTVYYIAGDNQILKVKEDE